MIKKGNQVLVLCGKDKGKKGEVIELLRSENKAKVKGSNIISNFTSWIVILYFSYNTLDTQLMI